MQVKITFKANPDLLRVGDIGTCLDGADESLRRQLSIVILGALRARKIPFRNPNGIKLPPESLDTVSYTHLTLPTSDLV